jgi:hypothetical protein
LKPVDTRVQAACFQLLKRKYDKLPPVKFRFRFQFRMRPYSKETDIWSNVSLHLKHCAHVPCGYFANNGRHQFTAQGGGTKDGTPGVPREVGPGGNILKTQGLANVLLKDAFEQYADALTLCPQLCMGVQPGARFHVQSADALPATLYGHFTRAIYRNQPILASL